MDSDQILRMTKACENIIETEKGLDDMDFDTETKIATLRSCVRTLAVVQRDLLKSVLE